MTKSVLLLAGRVMLLSAALLLAASTSAYAQFEDNQTCQPGIIAAYTGQHTVTYQTLVGALLGGAVSPATVQAHLDAVVNEADGGNNDADYAALLADAVAIRNNTYRVVIALPDGTVVVDTGAATNTFAAYKAKTVNENHNSRIAFEVAQHYQCGFGLETKISSSTGRRESYFAFRLGTHLDSSGTIRISIVQAQ